jgi:hypothetical protein
MREVGGIFITQAEPATIYPAKAGAMAERRKHNNNHNNHNNHNHHNHHNNSQQPTTTHNLLTTYLQALPHLPVSPSPFHLLSPLFFLSPFL